ncbi:MAG: hypothetical protein AB7O66_14045 [Limisphaerales bacterium]
MPATRRPVRVPTPFSSVAALSAFLTAWIASPEVQACAVCFGKTDSPLGRGLHWGVFALLGFVVVALAAFGAFAVYLVRRSRIVEAEEALEYEYGYEFEPMPAASSGVAPVSKPVLESKND